MTDTADAKAPPCSQDIRNWIYFRRFSGMYSPDVEAAISRQDSARSRSRSRTFSMLNYRPLTSGQDSPRFADDNDSSESDSGWAAPPRAAASRAAAWMAAPMAPPPVRTSPTAMLTSPPMSTAAPTPPPVPPAVVPSAGGTTTIINGPIVINHAHGHTPIEAIVNINAHGRTPSAWRTASAWSRPAD